MKLLFLIYYLIIQITIIQAKNQYLGCFVDQIGNRDLNIFIGDYEQLIPKQCILACQEQNYLYAAIQYGNECRCGQHYGKYGQVSDDECDYLCSTAEKCGGDNRNSVYKAVTSINILNTGLTCQNNLIGYQGCFDSVTLTNGIDVVNSIEECIKRCVVKYNYAGVMNGNLCYCENDLNLPSVNSNLCNIQCNKNTNDKTINCCGGLHVLSVYNIKNYQSSLLEDFSDKLIRVKRADAANESTYIPSYTTDVSSISTSLNNSTSLQTESFTGIASQSSITANSLPISSTISSLLNLNTNINEPVSSIPSTMSEVTSTTPISSTNTAEMLITTAYLSTNTTTSTDTSTLSTIIAASINSISISQPATNPMSSAESSSMYSIISETGTPSSSNIYTSAAITNTVATVSTPSAAFTSESFVQTSASGETSIGTASPLNMISSQTSQPLETTISINPISSISISNILTSIYMGNTESVTSSPITEFSSNSGNQPTNSINTVISSTSTMTSVPMLSELVSIASTNLFQTSTVSTSLNSISSNSITSNNLSSFSSIMTAESPSISSLTSMASSQVTETIFQQTNSQSSIPNTLFLSINSLSSSSTNIGLQTTITSSFSTAITTEQTTVTSSNISSTTVITAETVNSTVSTTQASTTTTTVASSNVITTVIIVPSNQNFTPNANATQELISTRLSAIIDLGFQCLYNPSNPNCTQTSGRKKRQLCQTGYNVNLVSNINEVSNTASSADYMIDYTVTNPCNQDALVPPAQVRTATDTLSRTQITNLLGYDYVGDLIQSTSIGNTSNPTTDNKLWIIGAVLGPVAFVLLLIFVFCYLHYKCRPRPTNRALAKAISNAPPVVAARATTYQIVSNESVKEKPTTEKNIQVLTQNDPLVGASTSSRQLTPIQSEKITHNTHEHPVVSNEISLDEIRRQNDVERWRNKLRLQEKFQQSPIGLQESSLPNTNRSDPYQYDNRAFEHDPSNINIQPASDIISIQTPRPISKTPEIEAGRTKLHRLLDEVLDKADSEEIYNPDSDAERQKRRRQRRRINSISNEQKTIPSNQEIPHIPVIPQVSARPDSALLNLRYNHYEAGDRAHDISRLAPVELKPKYVTDDQRYNQYSSRSNPPLFYNDSTMPDRAATATDAYANPKRFGKIRLETDQEAIMRHDGGQIERRQHKFNDDGVYIDSISRNRDGGYRVQARTAWVEPEEIDNNYRDNYMMAKRSVANTRNIISSIHNELKHINIPLSEDYHA